MKFRFGILLLFASLYCCPVLSGQTVSDTSRSDYALLWEISGKDLPAPSYVFGSMHVRYQSVFEFPDSLLICLQACDAVANEIHLDSAMQRMLEVYIGGEELTVDSAYIRFIKEKIYVTDSTQLTQRKEEEERDFRSILKDLGEGRDLRNGSMMPTMLDAHLMEIGRRWGKKHYGLEQIDQHFYESEEDVNFTDRMKFSWFGKTADDLLRFYYAGDIEPIEELIAEDPREFNRLALIARNYIMVKSMMRIMPKERLFSVVGVAHLPGKEGVIELLRQEGYTLRRVMPTFNQPVDSLLLQPTEREWAVREAQNGLFTYALPLDFQYVFHDGALTNYMSFDIGRGLSYLVVTASLRPYDKEDFDVNFFEMDGYEIDSKVPLIHAGLKGYVYELRKPNEDLQYFRAYTFEYDQMLYYLQVAAYEESTLEEWANTETFFRKFSLLKKNRNKWINLTDTLGGFRVRLPDHYAYSNPVLNERYPYEKANDFQLHQYRAGFEKPAASIWLQYYDTPADEELDELALFEDAQLRLELDYGIELRTTARDTVMNFPRWHIEGEFPDKGLQLSAQVTVRGSRTYILSRIDNDQGRITKKFLPSFELLPLRDNSPSTATSLVENELTVQLPGEPVHEYLDLWYDTRHPAKQKHQLRSQDPASGASYQADAYLISPLFSVQDSSTFYAAFFAEDEGKKEALLQRDRIIMDNGDHAQQLMYSTPHAQLFQKVVYYHRGRYLVRKAMTASLRELESPTAQRFFLADEWHSPTPDFDLFTDRTSDLLAGLQAGDSTAVYAALRALSPDNTFDADDLPKLRRIFLKNHWEKYDLTSVATHKLMPFLLENGAYGEQLLLQIFQEEEFSDTLRESILWALAYSPDEAGLPLIFRILEEIEGISPTLVTTALHRFDNQPERIAKYWPNFERLLANGKDPLQLWEFARQVTVQDTVDASPIFASADLFTIRGGERLMAWRSGDERTIPAAIFQLYSTFPDNDEMRYQAQAYHERPAVDWATLEATAYLLAKEEPLSNRQQKKMLREDSLRTPFLRLLNTYDQLDQISSKYYDQPTLARDLFLAEMADAGTLTNLKLVDELEVLFDAQARKIYLFTFDLDGNTNRLGIVGFFARDPAIRGFLDDGFVNYTTYTVTTRRRTRKAEQLVEELKERDNMDLESFDFYFEE